MEEEKMTVKQQQKEQLALIKENNRLTNRGSQEDAYILKTGKE